MYAFGGGCGGCSGCGTTCKPEGCHINSIKEYLCKMAKAACQLPCPNKIATDVVRVCQGSFDKGKCVEKCKGGCCCSGQNGQTQEQIDQAAQDACSGGCCGGKSCCGGGCSGQKSCSCSGKICNKVVPTAEMAASACAAAMACSGNSIRDAADFVVGAVSRPISAATQALSQMAPGLINPDVHIPSSMTELELAGMQEYYDARNMTPAQFRAMYCDQNPFPECAACKAANNMQPIDAYDLMLLVQGVTNTLRALTTGDAYGYMMLNCPGMMAALLSDKLGPIGDVLGKAAAGAMIGMSAIHGATQAFAGTVRALEYTPFLGELQYACMDAVMAGGGGPGFLGLINNVMSDLGLGFGDMICSYAPAYVPTGPIVNAPSALVPYNFTGPLASPDATLGGLIGGVAGGLLGGGTGALIGGIAGGVLGDILGEDGPGMGYRPPCGPGGCTLPPPQVTPVTDGCGHNGGFSPYGSSAGCSQAVDPCVGQMSAERLLDGYPGGGDIEPGSGRPLPDPAAQAAAKDAERELGHVINNADDLINNPDAPIPPPTSGNDHFVLIPQNETTVRPGIDYYKDVGDGDYVKLDTKVGEDLSGYRAEYGELWTPEFSKEGAPTDPDAGFSPIGTRDPGTTQYYAGDDHVPVTIKSDKEFDEAQRKYGEVYTKAEHYSPTTDAVGDPSKTYFRYDPSTDRYSEIPHAQIDGKLIEGLEKDYAETPTPIGPGTYYYQDGGKYVPVAVEPVQVYTTRPSYDPDLHTYYYKDGDDYVPVTVDSAEEFAKVKAEHSPLYTEHTKTTDEVFAELKDEHTHIFIEVKKPVLEISQEVLPDTLPQNSPLVFDNGIPFEMPVGIPSNAYQVTVDTSKLVTKTGIPAATMAQLVGIGMTVDEVKDAYLLDAEINGSTAPVDVDYERIPTILDQYENEGFENG